MRRFANSCLQDSVQSYFFDVLKTNFDIAGECRQFAIHPMANFQLGSSANSWVRRGFFFVWLWLFLAVLPSAFVKELTFGKSVLFLNAGFADGFFDRDFALDGLCVDEHLAAHGFGVFGEHF